MSEENKWSQVDKEYIMSVIDDNILTIGCVEFMLRIKKYRMSYLKWTSLAMLLGIVTYGFPYYTFFLPLLPIVIVNIVYFLDMNIVVFSLNKAHSVLIRNQIVIDWDELMGFALEYFTNQITNINDKSTD
jgi:hypothetical protein